MPEAIRQKIREGRLKRKQLLGYLNSPETRRRISEAQKGRTPWNKGKIGVQISPRRGVPLPQATKDKIRTKLLGTHLPEEQRRKISRALSGRTTWNKGVPHTQEHKRKIADAHRGSRSHFWIFDRSKLKKRDKRGDVANVEWRNQVKRLDGNRCRMRGSQCRGQLEVHHILRWSDFPELRYNINNGITLCHYHHPRKRNIELRLSPLFNKLVAERMLQS
jgi:hypothetical protein